MVERLKVNQFEEQYKKGRRNFSEVRIVKRSLDEIKEQLDYGKDSSSFYRSRSNLGGNFGRIYFEEVDFSNSDLCCVDFSMVHFYNCNFSNSRFVKTIMPKNLYINLRDEMNIVEDCNFSNSQLAYMRLNRSLFKNCDFQGVQLHRVKFPESLEGFLNLEKANGLYKCFSKSQRGNLPEEIQKKIREEIIERI